MRYDYLPRQLDGVWHNCLRITTDVPFDFTGQTVFEHTIETEDGAVTVRYLTNGLAEVTGDPAGGPRYYWFSCVSPPAMVDERLDEMAEALQTLGVEV